MKCKHVTAIGRQWGDAEPGDLFLCGVGVGLYRAFTDDLLGLSEAGPCLIFGAFIKERLLPEIGEKRQVVFMPHNPVLLAWYQNHIPNTKESANMQQKAVQSAESAPGDSA